MRFRETVFFNNSGLCRKLFVIFADNHRSGLRFTPMMSVLIGIVSALLIVGLVVIIVVRLQCTQNDDRRKRHKNAAVTAGSTEHRGSTSGPTLSDKGGMCELEICTV